MLPLEWDTWIQRLQDSIWEAYQSHRFNPQRGTYTAFREKRRIKEAEWRKLSSIIKEKKTLFCEMINACMGFGFGVRVYESPGFPGTPPRLLLTVTSDHFEDKTKPRPEGDDRSWGRFKKLVYTKHNVQLLEFNGKEKPREKSYYDY